MGMLPLMIWYNELDILKYDMMNCISYNELDIWGHDMTLLPLMTWWIGYLMIWYGELDIWGHDNAPSFDICCIDYWGSYTA